MSKSMLVCCSILSTNSFHAHLFVQVGWRHSDQTSGISFLSVIVPDFFYLQIWDTAGDCHEHTYCMNLNFVRPRAIQSNGTNVL